MTTCPACERDPCECDFTAEELVEAGRALSPQELAQLERIGAELEGHLDDAIPSTGFTGIAAV